MQKRKLVRLVLIAVVALVAYVAKQQGWVDGDGDAGPDPITTLREPRKTGEQFHQSSVADVVDTSAIDRAFAEERSGVWTEGQGKIVHVLADDNEGSRHQRFLLDIASGLTLKISHNIDLAHRVPAKKGDTLRFRGRYEWNEKGGVIHWTHHDPKGRIEGGWIHFDGKRFE